MFIRSAAALAAAGLGLGVVSARLLGSTAAAFVFQVEPTDPRILLSAACVLGATVLLASAIPARRAARLDPAAVLRRD